MISKQLKDRCRKRRNIAVAVFSIGMFALGGCVAPGKQMEFADGESVVSKDGAPVFLMSVTLRNSYNPSHHPDLYRVHVKKTDAANGEGNLNFAVDEKALNGKDKTAGNTYLLRMKLDPGEYVIRGLTSKTGFFPALAVFYAPLNVRMRSAGPGVFYLGHVDATIRETVTDEFRAGNPVPFVEQLFFQASLGATGTFDIEISDRWKEDGPQFLNKFPVLRSADVQSNILPPFDRGAAQAEWDNERAQPLLMDRGRLFSPAKGGLPPKRAARLDAAGFAEAGMPGLTDATFEETRFGKLSDTAALPFVNATARENYRSFLRAPYPRAFVIAGDGGWVWDSGLPNNPSDSKNPLVRALKRCTYLGHAGCKPYAINGNVVWKDDPLTSESPREAMKLDAAALAEAGLPGLPETVFGETGFAKLTDIAAIPFVNAKARKNYALFLKQKHPRAFVIANDGGWAWTGGLPRDPSDSKNPLIRALKLCAKLGHTTCKPYAIDDYVVWKTADSFSSMRPVP